MPAIELPGPAAKPSPPGDPGKPLPQRGADAYHPRQTILSTPVHITHPRQTLIQPDAPPAPPKIAVQIYTQGLMTKMTVRHMQGEPLEKTLAWAESEAEGFMRT